MPEVIASLDRIRLAITTFDEPDRLWRTLGDLLAQGFDPQQMCLMARPPIFASACRYEAPGFPPADRKRLETLCRNCEALPASLDTAAPTDHDDDAPIIVASNGPLLGLLLEDRAKAAVTMTPNESGGLALLDLTRADEVLLVVLSTRPSQQLTATRAMLAGSLRRVTTHEYPAVSRKTTAAHHLDDNAPRPMSMPPPGSAH